MFMHNMNREQFRALLERANMDMPMLRRLTGYNPDYATTLGKRRPVPRSILALVEAWYLMDGPKRQELLKAIGDTET